MHWLIVNGELVLYGFVGDADWDVQHFTARDVLDALVLMSGDVTVRLNSGGGLSNEGLAIYNSLRLHAQRNKVKIKIIVDAVALSSASLIAMAGDTVVMAAGSTMMIHDPSTFTFGNADEQRETADVLDKMADQYAAIYAEKAGITAEEARAIMKAETWYSADEAVEAGFADEVMQIADMRAPTVFDYRLYSKSPSSLTTLATASAMMFQPKAAPAAQPQENGMTLEQLIAMLAARYGSSAADVTTMCNQALAAGIEMAVLVTMLQGTATMAAGKDAIKAKVTEMLGSSTALTQPSPVQPQQATAVTMSVADIREVTTRAQQAGLDLAAASAIMALPTKEAAFAAIIDKVFEMKGGGQAPTATAHVTEDARDKFRAGAVKALMAKVGHKDGERNEFSGLTLTELARESLMVAGVTNARRMDRMQMIGAAFTGAGGAVMISGMHTTSDFSSILENVAAKSALKGYQEADETFEKWTSKGSASDFKPTSRVDLGLFPALLKVEEGSEFKYGTIGDRKATVIIATYGRLIAISRQAIINDDLSILGKLPIKMGRAAKRTVGNLVYAILTGNPTMADGVTLFHANHGNLGTAGAPSATTWEEATNKMGSQKDADANATALNIRPRYFLSGAYEFLAKQLLTSTGSLESNKSAAVANTVQGLVEPITDRRITGNQWFFAADPNLHDTIEVTYLDGVEEPVVEAKDGWTIDGTELKVRLDAGANLLDYRGLVKNAGA